MKLASNQVETYKVLNADKQLQTRNEDYYLDYYRIFESLQNTYLVVLKT